MKLRKVNVMGVITVPTATPATAAPPSTGGLNSVCGSLEQFARSDHTHASSVQKAKVVTDASGIAVWNFGKAFDDLNFAVNALAQGTTVITITIAEVAENYV